MSYESYHYEIKTGLNKGYFSDGTDPHEEVQKIWQDVYKEIRDSIIYSTTLYRPNVKIENKAFPNGEGISEMTVTIYAADTNDFIDDMGDLGKAIFKLGEKFRDKLKQNKVEYKFEQVLRED